MEVTPLAIDLFCGSFGFSAGWLEIGGYVVGFDLEHLPHHGPVPNGADLVIQDVLTLHGKQFKDAALIVASPPCTEFSWMAMPWSRAKQVARALCGEDEFPANYRGSRTVAQLTALFDACFRIQREAIEVAGHFIPLVVENVRGAIPWVGRSRWNYGSYHLWGDVPALMPMTKTLKNISGGSWFGLNPDGSAGALNNARDGQKFNPDGTAHPLGSWFAVADSKNRGQKTTGIANQRDGHSHTQHLTNQVESDHVKFSQSGAAWFYGTPRDKMLGNPGPAAFDSKSTARKAASAAIAKIPRPLAEYIARFYYPRGTEC